MYKYVITDLVTVRKFTTLAMVQHQGRIVIESGEPMRIIDRMTDDSQAKIYSCKFLYENEGFKANKIFRFREQDLIPYKESKG